MRTYFFSLLFSIFLLCLSTTLAHAQTAKMGMHVLTIEEVEPAVTLLREQSGSSEEWYYITIPFTTGDVARATEWQQFFNKARQLRVIPIVRLATTAKNGAWEIPTRKNITDQLNVLARLEWPTGERRVIMFNEVNHAKEWGNKIDPQAYAETFRFAASWAHALQKNFIVLPAAMDLAAPNGAGTQEALGYLERMHQYDNEIFTYADAWNSHSYPNPAFSAPPQRKGKNSLYGYEHELAFLKQKGVQDLPVYITETGWETNRVTSRYLSSWYHYAFTNIWEPDARIVAVTPFVFKGSPGPFADFSFVSAEGKPTLQYDALKNVLGASVE